MLLILGRADGEGSNSSSQVLASNAHNGSENPSEGRSGRRPHRTFCITAASGSAYSNGRRPVTIYRGKVRSSDRCRSELIRTSRIVMPRAYMSVLFDGNFLRALLVYPYFSGSRISGAIHRIVPPALWLLGPSTEVVSSMIAASPKSAKQARHSELMRMLACISTSPVNAV